VTLCLVVLTGLQARGSTLTRSIHLVGQSRSLSLFVLRAVSELTALSLSGSISLMFERLKWTLVCRSGKGGASPTRLTHLLALDESTPVLALISLAGSPAVGSRGARVWSILRLLLVALVPVTGILIMSESGKSYDHPGGGDLPLVVYADGGAQAKSISTSPLLPSLPKTLTSASRCNR